MAPIYLGSDLVDPLYVGGNAVDEVYVGSGQAYSSGGGPGPTPDEDTSGVPVTGFAVAEMGWMGARLTWTKVDVNHTYLQIQRKLTAGSYPSRDLDAARGWSNFYFLPFKSHHFVDLECSYNTSYTYRIRSATKVDNGTAGWAWKFGPWSEAVAAIPNYTEQNVSLSSYDTSGATDNGDEFRTDWAAAKAITDGDPNKIAVLDFSAMAGTIAVCGPSASNGNILSVGASNRIWLKGPGKDTLRFRFYLPGLLDPETNVIYNTDLWTSGMSVSTNDTVLNGNYKYRATNSGTAGTNAPTHTSGNWTDNNGITWAYVSKPAGYTEVKRGFFFLFGTGAKWNKFSGVEFDGNTRPTGTKDWYTIQDSLTGWDVNHKAFVFGFGTELVDYTLLDNIRAKKWRGEIIYSGSNGIGKVTCLDCEVSESNGSAYSLAADLMIRGGHVRDAVNACDESALFYNVGSNGVYQNSMLIDVELTPRYYWLLSVANNPILISNQGGYHCAAIFGQQNTCTLYDRVTFQNSRQSGVYGESSQRNTAWIDCSFDNLCQSGSWGDFYIKTWLQNKSIYNLTGGKENFEITGCTFDRSTAASKNGGFLGFFSYPAMVQTGARVMDNDFNVTGTRAPRWLFEITYDHRGSGLYQDVEFSQNRGNPGAGTAQWDKRGGGGYARPKTHDNDWGDTLSQTGQAYANASATQATLDPILDGIVISGLPSAGCSFFVNNNTQEIQNSMEVTITSVVSAPARFLASNNTLNLTDDITITSGDQLKLRFNSSTAKWDFVSLN